MQVIVWGVTKMSLKSNSYFSRDVGGFSFDIDIFSPLLSQDRIDLDGINLVQLYCPKLSIWSNGVVNP